MLRLMLAKKILSGSVRDFNFVSKFLPVNSKTFKCCFLIVCSNLKKMKTKKKNPKNCSLVFSFALSEGCEVGQWSEWGTCSRNNKTCGFKWGLETRTRQIVKKPVKDTIPCPTIAESRRCKMAMRHCPGGKRSHATKIFMSFP